MPSLGRATVAWLESLGWPELLPPLIAFGVESPPVGCSTGPAVAAEGIPSALMTSARTT
jgi:hypothetical protein